MDDDEIKLNIEKWPLKLDGEIKDVITLENNYTFILTIKYFYVYDANKDLLTQNTIPFIEEQKEIKEKEKEKKKDKTEFDNTRIWSDKNGSHIIFKLDGFTYYYNNVLPVNNKIKLLNLEFNQHYLEPYSIAFNNNNQNLKYTDEIIFSDENSSIYTLTIKIEENGEVNEKVNNVFNFRIKKGNNSNEEENNLFEENYFLIDKHDRIYDMKLYVHEEKVGTGKKAVINKSYFILAVSKCIIFQFSGKNTIKDVFIKYKKETNIIDKDEILKDCKIFPKIKNINLEKTRIQLFTSQGQKPHFYWNNECGFCLWTSAGSPLPLSQKEFTLYNYIKMKNDGTYEKNPCPVMCCQTSYCIYFLYKDCLVVLNIMTNNITHIEYFKEEYLDIYYNKQIDKLILFSKNNIIRISIEHEINNLWKNYIERGEYNIALQNFNLNDENIKAKLHKLNGDLLFKRKDYDASAFEYGLSDENFEHICLKFLKLNDINPLINYLNFVCQFRCFNNDNKKKDDITNNSDESFIQKYLINTWLFELILQNEDIKKKEKNYVQKDLKKLIFDSGYIESENYLDKITIFKLLQSYGRYKDYIEFAGRKNDYQTIIFDLVNHNKYKEAINNLIMYMSFSDNIEDESNKLYLQNLIKIFFTYINIFIKESPKEVLELISKYYSLIENPLDIIKTINNINIYDNNIFDENFENILNLIKKLINVCKKSEKNINEYKKYNLSFRQNLNNLYILYLSLSFKLSHYNELLDFFKTLVNNSISKNMFYYDFSLNNQIYFEFTFAQNILKKSKSILGLLYFLKKDYNRSVSMALSNEDKDTSIFIANSISDPKKKKEIWLQIFNHYRESNEIIEEILKKSGGVLKILDILPYLMGNVHLKEIKNELKNCINVYESKLRKLKIYIKDFGQSVDILSQKVDKALNKGHKSIKLKLEEINCAICFKNLKELNFYLFPCKHVFDFDCLVNTLLYYESRNIGDDIFKKKMIGIKHLLNEIRQLNLRKKNIYEKKNSISQNQKKQNVVTEFFRSLTTTKNININNVIDFSANEENQLQDLERVLDELLSQECPICGNEMILSTQIKFGDEDNIDWKI